MHSHDHHHTHEPIRERRSKNAARLAWALALTLAYMVAEAVGGWLAGSLALLADAGHMLSDAAALGLSLMAIRLARRPPNALYSYGFYRAEILAALANGVTLVVISIFIFIEAAQRIGAPPEVQGSLLLGIASGGLVVNLVGMSILHAGRTDSLNIHGAWLHLLSDALGSVAALTAGGLIWARGWYWVDPVASILIGALIVLSSWGLLKESIAVLMESTPRHLDLDRIHAALSACPGVCQVHDLHIWTITSGLVSLSAHAVLAPGNSPPQALEAIRRLLHEQFGIDHMTIQLETDEHGECRTSFEV